MPARFTLSRQPARAVLSTLAIAVVLTSARPASAQWNPRGANFQMWGCSGGANQTWLFRK